MSSPNEPGYPGPGENPGDGNGSADRGGAPRSGSAQATGRITASGDVPPWQRGAARAPQPPPRPAPESRAPGVGRDDLSARPTGQSPGGDTRIDRFVSGTAAPTAGASSPAPVQAPEAGPGRAEGARPEAYTSELPDLSGPMPRPRTAGPGRSAAETTSGAAGQTRPSVASSRAQVTSRSRGPVRASMQIRRIDPWSALKVSLLLSVALFFVWMIAVAFLYLVLGGMGVWSKLNSNVGDLLTNTSSGELVSSGAIFGGAALIGLVNIVLLTAMATIGAFIYNLTTDLVGGVEVTLADRD